jgi:hypothetical protein
MAYLNILTHHLPRYMDKNYEVLFKMANNAAKIQTRYLLNTSLQLH